ncbi:acetylxylan esterase [Propionibacteriaceae bacterium Y1685]|uniref:acetylxylan esterase n=1 Tax=Microlunatus sp. Y1700 TaxID=3418487 RepID=UPI003B7B90FE
MPVTRVTGVTHAGQADLSENVLGADFDGTYGHDVDSLWQFGPPEDEPDDFDAFWWSVRAEAAEVDAAPECGPWESLTGTQQAPWQDPAGQQVATISYTALDGVRINGWLVRGPGEPERALVVGHGYGGRDAPTAVGAGMIAIQPISRGLPGSPVGGIGDQAARHVVSGLDTPRGYVHVGAAADLWAAATVLEQLAPGVPIGYLGGSYGGGIGALALPWDDRFTAASLHVPSFGNHPVRLTLPCCGSGEAVRTHVATQPEARRVLAYADAATTATRVRIPVLCSVAAFDPAVPPPGQFAVANALGGPTWVHVQPNGHSESPEELQDQPRRAANEREFWADPDAAVRRDQTHSLVG